jgi:hypothetical protein
MIHGERTSIVAAGSAAREELTAEITEEDEARECRARKGKQENGKCHFAHDAVPFKNG